MKMECVQCDAEFTMSEQEIERYEEMGFDLPRRCPQCRKHKIKMSEDGPAGRKSRDKKKFYRIKYTDR